MKPAILLCCFLISSCTQFGVEPWERDLLAKKEMAVISDRVEAGLDDHIYFSKEASSGGASFGGGAVDATEIEKENRRTTGNRDLQPAQH